MADWRHTKCVLLIDILLKKKISSSSWRSITGNKAGKNRASTARDEVRTVVGNVCVYVTCTCVQSGATTADPFLFSLGTNFFSFLFFFQPRTSGMSKDFDLYGDVVNDKIFKIIMKGVMVLD
jgi:hypothetical protein